MLLRVNFTFVQSLSRKWRLTSGIQASDGILLADLVSCCDSVYLWGVRFLSVSFPSATFDYFPNCSFTPCRSTSHHPLHPEVFSVSSLLDLLIFTMRKHLESLLCWTVAPPTGESTNRLMCGCTTQTGWH